MITANGVRFKIDKLITSYLDEKCFSACSLGFFKIDESGVCRELFFKGKLSEDLESKEVGTTTIFDLASLTKPLVTSMIFLLLLDKGLISFEDRLEKFYPYLKDKMSSIKMIDLLQHSSGLPAHRPYFKTLINIPFERRKEFLIKQILSEKLVYDPGKECIYSDLGFIILGDVLEKTANEKIEKFWEKNILKPLKIKEKIYFPTTRKDKYSEFAETGICFWSKKKLSGIVNDDNCRALGGVAGHAGLFASAPGLLSYVENLLKEIKCLSNKLQLKNQTIDVFFKRQSNSSWVSGFDTPSKINSSSGKYFSRKTLGHLGFTGTSFWMDIEKSCGIVFLTNRTLCSKDLNKLKTLRPLIHDVIMKNLLIL